MLKEIFVGSKVYDDETANETVDETDDDQPGTTDMPDLESEESAEQRYWKGLKILTPDQMFSRLPISLAQLKAGNNSVKLKNEIRQLLYSLYYSNKLTNTIYNILINTIWKWKQSLWTMKILKKILINLD